MMSESRWSCEANYRISVPFKLPLLLQQYIMKRRHFRWQIPSLLACSVGLIIFLLPCPKFGTHCCCCKNCNVNIFFFFPKWRTNTTTSIASNRCLVQPLLPPSCLLSLPFSGSKLGRSRVDSAFCNRARKGEIYSDKIRRKKSEETGFFLYKNSVCRWHL